jgi:SpoVK/Ycf46/Vps4 family AAA+-type ATPase
MKSKIKVVSPNNVKVRALKNKKIAKHITTKKTWKNLDVDRTIKLQLNSINFITPKAAALHVIGEEKNDAKAGQRILFAGKVKGKKLAAKLIGKQNSTNVYRIDLASVVSNYIGETEKNLDKLFETATEKNWILFFDEADALFGKRTSVKDAHDRYADQDMSHLNQQINKYPALIIFSLKNDDDSSAEYPIHLDSVIHFKKPS